MDEIFESLGLKKAPIYKGEGHLASCFAVTTLAADTLAAVGVALSELMTRAGFSAAAPPVTVDRRLASLWFGFSLHPEGWALPPVWDAIAGDYETNDGWIKLHTNLPHHRHAACRVLKTSADRNLVARAVNAWAKDTLETAIVEAGGVAAAMRSRAEWQAHPQGAAVAQEPLIDWNSHAAAPKSWPGTVDRPLRGLRVLDLTRVLAGPVATRTLAGFGADVLRLDPPVWEEPNVIPEITPGKRCARLDLKTSQGRQTFEELLGSADILVHGYRPGALEGLGFEESWREAINPGLIDVSLNAYGWTGPWAGRRGFDSLVQMSSGIAHAGMEWAGTDKPYPLPVQALDFATGYLMAAAVLVSLTDSLEGSRRQARLSLTRTAELLMRYPSEEGETFSLESQPEDINDTIEETSWGPARRLTPPFFIGDLNWHWDRPATALGAALPQWAGRAP